MTVICFAIAGHVYRPGQPISLADLMGWPTVIAMVVFAGVTFTLQSMRIRDIGWDPVCVIPMWIAIVVVDKLIAGKIPGVVARDLSIPGRSSASCSTRRCFWR